MEDKKKETLGQTLKYLLLSISAGVIQLGSFTILNEFVFKDGEYGPSYFIALVLSVVYNFTLNREFTFKSANNVPKAMLQVLAYYLVFTPLSIWWGESLEGIGWNEYLVLGMTMVINFVTEFLFWKFVVYRGSENTNARAMKEKQASVEADIKDEDENKKKMPVDDNKDEKKD